jgi:hypothetical protein
VNVKTVFHAMFGILSFGLIVASLLTSLIVEILNSQGAIADVKALIFQSILLLLVFLGFATLLGLSLGKARSGNIVDAKKRRVIWLFAIATFILLPIAYVLDEYAMQGQFNWTYLVLQGIEYIFDIIFLILLGLNIRDGNTLVRQSQGRF